MKYNGIHHLAMATGNMDATLRFWRDLLGMRLVLGMGKPGYRNYFLEVSESTLITFFEWPHVEPVPEKDHGYPASGPLIFDHVSFGVNDEETLWELRDKLEAAEVWVSEIIDHGFIRSVYTFDPNGIPIEFSVSVEGVDIRRHPRMLDRSPTPVAMEGPDPRSGMWPAVTSPAAVEDRAVYPGEGKDVLVDGRKDYWSIQSAGPSEES